MRVVFMGTPEIAAKCLERVIEAGYEVAGVFTQPDRPRGRGHKLVCSEVKQVALAHSIPIYQPLRLRGNQEALEQLRALKPDVTVVVAYGQILPPSFLEVAPLGAINVHASLLPKLRGAAPIQWSILNGDPQTGVTTMYMAEGLDTGDMLEQVVLDIDPDESSGQLFERMAKAGGDCLLTTLQKLRAGSLKPTPQNHAEATWASPLTKETGKIDFSKDTLTIHNQIRGCNPWPVAYTRLGDKLLKVYRGAPAALKGKAGELLDERRLIIGTGDGSIELLEVVLEGGKKNTGAQLINGQRLVKGQKFTQ